MTDQVLSAVVVAGSPAFGHDLDFARLQLLQALYDAGNIRAVALPDYSNHTAIEGADLLLSYTSQLRPSAEDAAAVERFLKGGGRWFAMHGSSSVPADSPLPAVVGSRFVGHEAYRLLSIEVTAPKDPIVASIEPFEVDDEPYCLDAQDSIEVLLHSHWGASFPDGRVLPEAMRPLMYRYRVGEGEVLYLALGHRNRTMDHAPDREAPPERVGPWDLPVYKELLRRSVAWAAKRL